MCGSATLAIDVSSTSMNVASVTVTAITHGLIDPSGILSLASNLCLIARSISFAYALLGVASLYRLLRMTAQLTFFITLHRESLCRSIRCPNSRGVSSSALLRNDRRVHIHPRPQHRFVGRNWIQHDLHWYPLHHFHVVPRRVFRRQQTEHSARRPRNRIHMPAERHSIRIDFHFRLLPRLHVFQLCLFKI